MMKHVAALVVAACLAAGAPWAAGPAHPPFGEGPYDLRPPDEHHALDGARERVRAQRGGDRHRLLPGDGAAGDLFGFAVDVSGDTIAVGAPWVGDNGQQSGAVYVFNPDGDGIWRQMQKLIASDGAEFDFFGQYLGMSGDTIVSGAFGDDGPGSQSGSAYIFTREQGVWRQTQKVRPPDRGEVDCFGAAVAIEGATINIGAHHHNESWSHGGAAYFYEPRNGSWRRTAKFEAMDTEITQRFAYSVGADHDTLVSGAYTYLDFSIDTGYVIVHERDGRGWRETAVLAPHDQAITDRFGIECAVDGDVIIAGAPESIVHGVVSGAAYVFERNGRGDWVETAKLVASGGETLDEYGIAVAVENDVLIVGASGDDDRGEDAGAAYIYRRNGSTWALAGKLRARDGRVGDFYGRDVAVGERYLVIGALRDDSRGSDSGAAFVYEYRAEPPEAMSVTAGIHVRGEIAELLASDDRYVEVVSQRPLQIDHTSAQIEITTTSFSQDPSALSLHFEGHSSGQPSRLRFELYDARDAAWQVIDEFDAPISDVNQSICVDQDAGRFVDQTDGMIRARVGLADHGVPIPDWAFFVDRVEIMIVD